MRPVVVTTSDASGGVKTSNPVPMDIYGRPEVSLQADVTGTANYTVQQTLDDVFDSTVSPTWFDHPDSTLVAATADAQGNYAYIPRAIRLKQNSGSGSVRLTIIQAGVAGAG